VLERLATQKKCRSCSEVVQELLKATSNSNNVRDKKHVVPAT